MLSLSCYMWRHEESTSMVFMMIVGKEEKLGANHFEKYR